jgi:hypothetical protein
MKTGEEWMPRLVWLVLLSWLASCDLDQSCTLVGYQDGLFVAFVRQDGAAMPSGAYTATIRAEGAEATVTWQRPGGAPSATVALSGGRSLRVTSTLLRAPADGLLFILRDRDGREAGGPRELDITLAVDGATVADASFAPRYTREEPNGDGCGTWTHAEVELPITP